MSFIQPDWPTPANIHSAQTTRQGGVSLAPYASLNMATHVGDDPAHVAINRRLLREQLALPAEPLWLEQVHGIEVYTATHTEPPSLPPRADASYTDQPGIVLAILTADCLPVLFTSRDGQEIAAAHAGWRGLLAGILEATLTNFHAPPTEILAWFGPAIGRQAFEVGDDVRHTFIQHAAESHSAFTPSAHTGHWYADLYTLARQRLAACGVHDVRGGNLCSYSDAARFYSYRRENPTGRMASLIWKD